MASTYARLLSKPGALSFSAAGMIARFPMSMVGISTILAVQASYGSYQAAGLVSAAGVVAAAVGSPLLARQVDAHGQRRVMLPATLASAASLAGLALTNYLQAPLWLLTVLAALAGGLSGSIGALARARWSHLLSNPEEIHTAFSFEAALDEVAFVIGPVVATVLCTTAPLPAESGWIASLLLQLVGVIWFLSQTATEPPVAPRRAASKSMSPVNDPGGAPAADRAGAEPGANAQKHASSANHTSPLAHKPVLRHGAVLVVLGVFLFDGALFGANDVAVVARATELGAKSFAGLVLASFAAGSLVSALVYGARSWSWPLWKQLLVGSVALALGCTSFMVANQLYFLAALMMLTGVAIAPTITTGNNIVQVSVPAGSLTEGLAWVGTALNVGVSLGSYVGGVLLDAHGSTGGYIFVAAMAWTAVATALVGLPVLRRAQPARTLRHKD
ncbi:H+ Antiporter protein [Actinomyces bovis]|uniref:H+ Antiporter protein n=1 Tax=Actinomyces bovis TaxID=1658 RepID=A0ABY1VQB7_9ACTO|nr:MFS transporter [Actinomyces bovis]SPT53592.1 H+ Antiporter protein [Actinomyces bovis]VEG55614.1 H+ Antiporter protein [Actinomyces israelii]